MKYHKRFCYRRTSIQLGTTFATKYKISQLPEEEHPYAASN